MNNSRRLFAAAVLTLAFMLPAAAGEISTGVGVCQPPPPPAAATAQGDISFPRASAGAAGGEADDADPLTQVMLGLLQSVLTLL